MIRYRGLRQGVADIGRGVVREGDKDNSRERDAERIVLLMRAVVACGDWFKLLDCRVAMLLAIDPFYQTPQ